MIEQLDRVPGVLTRNQIDVIEDFQRAPADIAEVSNWSSDYEEGSHWVSIIIAAGLQGTRALTKTHLNTGGPHEKNNDDNFAGFDGRSHGCRSKARKNQPARTFETGSRSIYTHR